MKKILVPTDFSPSSENAIDYALAMAEQMGATVDIIHVFHLSLADASSIPPEFIQEMLDDQEKQVFQKLETLVKGKNRSLIGQLKPKYGIFITQEITDWAAQQNYDLIIMGTRGKHSRVEKFLGSVSTHTMMQASCPVMAIPAEIVYKPISSIVYATSFDPKDEQAIDQLFHFAKSLQAKVHLIHIDTEKKGSIWEENYATVRNFPSNFASFTVKSNPSARIGLEEFVKENAVEVIALFIPHRRLWEQLFHTSFSKRMTFHSNIPLLTFRN